MSSISAGTTSTTTLVHSGDTTGSLVFKTNDTGSGGTTAVTIDTSQNVGIGITPSTKLDVSGTSRYTFNVANAYTLQTSINAAGSAFVDDYKNALSHIWQTSGSERMRINSSGNVGIGVTSISSWSLGKALEIGFVGNGMNGASQTQSSWICNAYYDGSWKYGGTGKATLVQCDAGSINTLTATSSGSAGGAITWTTGPYVSNGGTSWTSSSDERLKNITGEIENALDKVGQLRAARFTWKSDADNKPQVGLIAQDVQAVLPEVVNSTAYIIDDETEYLGINYDQVIPLLVASIKELKAINDQQAETINALTARVVALESK